jgi:hypothetical protein
MLGPCPGSIPPDGLLHVTRLGAVIGRRRTKSRYLLHTTDDSFPIINLNIHSTAEDQNILLLFEIRNPRNHLIFDLI